MINLAFPLFDAVDWQLAALMPLFVRLVLYGALAGAAALGLYVLLSSQHAIAAAKKDIRAVRGRLLRDDMEGREALRLALRNLLLSLKLLRQVFFPALLSSVPVLLIAAWLDSRHAVQPPDAGGAVEVNWIPADVPLRFSPVESARPAPGAAVLAVSGTVEALRVTDAEGRVVYQGHAGAPAAPAVHKRRWWNALWESEAGYLDKDAPISALYFSLPRRIVLSGVPEWMGTWEFFYFLSLVVTAVAIKLGFRIE